jgi:hypothetical protein
MDDCNQLVWHWVSLLGLSLSLSEGGESCLGEKKKDFGNFL